MTNDLRRRDLAEIHALKRNLGLDDEAYRDLIEAETGQRSAGDLDRTQRFKVLLRMRRDANKSGVDRKRHAPRKHRPHNIAGMLSKIEALLSEMKLSWTYANGIAKRMYKVDQVAWLNEKQLLGVMVALKKHGQRKGADVW